MTKRLIVTLGLIAATSTVAPAYAKQPRHIFADLAGDFPQFGCPK